MANTKKPKPRQLEDYEPGATREGVFAALRKAAKDTKEEKPPAKKRGGSPDSSSSET